MAKREKLAEQVRNYLETIWKRDKIRGKNWPGRKNGPDLFFPWGKSGHGGKSGLLYHIKHRKFLSMFTGTQVRNIGPRLASSLAFYYKLLPRQSIKHTFTISKDSKAKVVIVSVI